MLTNIQLESMTKYYNIPLISCCMKNELPKSVLDGGYIINLQSSPLSGSHWTALFIKGSQAMFCDSFGATPSIEVVNFVKQRGEQMRLGYNNCIIQDLHSNNCGYYCIAFLLFMKNKLKRTQAVYSTADKYLKTYTKNTDLNDVILAEIIDENINKEKPLHTQINRLFNEHRIKNYDF